MDIIERLLGGDGQGWAIGHETRREAATEITRLREENKRMREAICVTLARLEALEDEASDGLSADNDEHADGFWRGQKSVAKSLRSHLHDMTRTALANTGGE
jgi:hypothetical protein